MIREIRLARERMAEQSHPHESRAKAFEETMAKYISQDHSDVVDNGGIVNSGRKKKKDGHDSNARSVRWELAHDDKRRQPTEQCPCACGAFHLQRYTVRVVRLGV